MESSDLGLTARGGTDSAAPRVLITGGAGFIGGYVVEEFAAAGWHVIALIHRHTSDRLRELADEGRATLVQGDAADPAITDAVLVPALARKTPAAIVHCAGRASDVGWRREFRRSHLDALCHLAALAKRFEVDCLTFVSTTDVYGLGDFHGEAEDELPLRNNTGNPYPEYKIRAERHLTEQLPPGRWATIRPAAVWGLGDQTLMPRLVDFLRWSPAVIYFGHWRGANRWPLAHVRNVAAAVYLATTTHQFRGQAVNVLDDEMTTVAEFQRIVAELSFPGRRFAEICIPEALAWPAAAAVTALSNLLNLDRPVADPSLYALRTINSHLDFSNRRLHVLLEGAGRRLVTRDEGVTELREPAEAGR